MGEIVSFRDLDAWKVAMTSSSPLLAKIEKQLTRTGQLLNGVMRSVRRQQLKALGSAGLVLIACLFFV